MSIAFTIVHSPATQPKASAECSTINYKDKVSRSTTSAWMRRPIWYLPCLWLNELPHSGDFSLQSLIAERKHWKNIVYPVLYMVRAEIQLPYMEMLSMFLPIFSSCDQWSQDRIPAVSHSNQSRQLSTWLRLSFDESSRFKLSTPHRYLPVCSILDRRSHGFRAMFDPICDFLKVCLLPWWACRPRLSSVWVKLKLSVGLLCIQVSMRLRCKSVCWLSFNDSTQDLHLKYLISRSN